MERARYLVLQNREGEAQVDEYDVVDALYDLKELEPSPEVVDLATKLEGIVILFLMRSWELSVQNVLTDYMNKRTRTTDQDFESEMRSIALRAEALKDATVLSNQELPDGPMREEVDKRVQTLREVIQHIENLIVILYLMRSWELSVKNVLTDYMNKRTRTTDKDFESEMRSIAVRAEALKDATVLSNPELPDGPMREEVDKRVQNLREVIQHIEDFLG